MVFFLYNFRRRKKLLQKFGHESLTQKLSSSSVWNQKIKSFLIAGTLLFVILSLSRPQYGAKMVETKQQSTDIVIAVDVSNSMLAEDIKPNRLTSAKNSLTALTQILKGNRIGIIAFAGTAFWQCPLTIDISSVNLFLQIMDTNLIPLGGTSIGDAIRLAIKGLKKTAPKSKAIILLTDGEDHKSNPEDAAQTAASEGVKIFTIGFGNPNGEPIPERDAGGKFSGYKKDKKGEVVMSKLDENLLMKIAEETSGRYFNAQNGNIDIAGIATAIDSLDKQKVTSSLNRRFEDRFQFFLFFALILFIIELLIPETRKKKYEN